MSSKLYQMKSWKFNKIPIKLSMMEMNAASSKNTEKKSVRKIIKVSKPAK